MSEGTSSSSAFEIDERFTPKAELKAFCEEWKTTTERIDRCATYREAQALAGKAPAMPVTYLAVKELDLPPSLPVKKMTAAIHRVQRDFVGRFPPGATGLRRRGALHGACDPRADRPGGCPRPACLQGNLPGLMG
jgi:phage host-nuclease inhibitor protein Gam